jgi:hypothetical protein
MRSEWAREDGGARPWMTPTMAIRMERAAIGYLCKLFLIEPSFGNGSAPLDLTRRECNAQGGGREFSPTPGSGRDGKEVKQAVLTQVQVHGGA